VRLTRLSVRAKQSEVEGSRDAAESSLTGLEAATCPETLSGLLCSLDFARNDVYIRRLMPDNTSLTCPRCTVPLKEVRTSGGVFYGYDVCGGSAVTIELLHKRFTPESINPLWLHAMRGEGRVGLPCPSCRQPMIGVALADRAEISVDVCQRCHFIWFDAHEGEALVPRQPQRSAPELPQKAREILAIAEVERLSKQAEGPDLDSARPRNRGSRSPPSLECRSSSMRRRSSEDRGRPGCFPLPSFASVSLLFHICARSFNVPAR
jgi:Zn-finger nucleic acid-binding protein